jgi:acetoacetyl-CoA synthetase
MVVQLKPGCEERPLFVIHAVFGDVFELRSLVAHLNTERAVYGVRARPQNRRARDGASVQEMAEDYVRQVQAIQPGGPYALAGYSFGGLVAFEMARVLSRTNDLVDPLILIDTNLHSNCLAPLPRVCSAAARKARLFASGLREPKTSFPRWLRNLTSEIGQGTRASLAWRDAIPATQLTLEQANLAAYAAYRPSNFSGRATFMRAQVRNLHECDPIPIWSRLVQLGLTVESVPGDHSDILTEPNVRILADRIAAHL